MTVDYSLEGELKDAGIDRASASRIAEKIENLIEEKIQEEEDLE